MKKIFITLFAVIPAMTFAQVKPSIPKAEKALREFKFDEAKTIIDATTSNQDFMVDKKGQPSKNAAKAWFMKGLIYAAIDTTKKAEFKSLDPNPFGVAKEAFEKCKEIDGGKTLTWVSDPANGLPQLNENLYAYFAASYLNTAVSVYNEKTDDKDKKFANSKAALEACEKTLYFVPEDTSVLLYAGGIFAPSIKEYDKGIELLNRYIKAGGRQAEAYTMIASIYRENKKDNESALKILKEGKEKFPNYKDLALMELNIYLSEKKYDVARKMVEDDLKADPANKDNYFLYGQLNRELGETEKAKEAFRKVLELDPKSFDAAAELANLYWAEAKKIKDEMGALSSSKTDMEKMKKLDVLYVEKLKIYIPYIETCEKLSPDDVTVLYSLLNVYGDLDEQPKIARIKKKLKALGEDVN